jgi:hypothetical protein
MSSPHNISTATRIVSYLATEPVNGAAAAPKKEILDQRAERLAGYCCAVRGGTARAARPHCHARWLSDHLRLHRQINFLSRRRGVDATNS